VLGPQDATVNFASGFLRLHSADSELNPHLLADLVSQVHDRPEQTVRRLTQEDRAVQHKAGDVRRCPAIGHILHVFK